MAFDEMFEYSLNSDNSIYLSFLRYIVSTLYILIFLLCRYMQIEEIT
jgi:hypothetical protein